MIYRSSSSPTAYKPTITAPVQPEIRFSQPTVVRMSLDSFASPKTPALEVLSARADSDSQRGDTFGSATRVKKKEKLDPAKMQPAGVKTAKDRTFNQKYSAHHFSELIN